MCWCHFCVHSSSLTLVYSQSTYKRESNVIHKQQKLNEATYLKELRRVDKKVVLLDATLEKTNHALKLIQLEQSYTTKLAVNNAKQEEREHFTTIVRTERDQGRKLQSVNTVSSILLSVSFS